LINLFGPIKNSIGGELFWKI